VRALTALAPYSQYPYKGTHSDLNKLRELFHDKISTVLGPLNKENPIVKNNFTLGEFIQQNYFSRLGWRLKVPPQHIDGAWFGWHAFRRGLGTRLNEANVDDKEIQSILRHADVSTTQAYYILPNRKRAEVGLKKLGRVARKKYGIKG